MSPSPTGYMSLNPCSAGDMVSSLRMVCASTRVVRFREEPHAFAPDIDGAWCEDEVGAGIDEAEVAFFDAGA